jgi:hypothetical protein
MISHDLPENLPWYPHVFLTHRTTVPRRASVVLAPPWKRLHNLAKMDTLWLCQQFAIEAMAIEIVDFPMKNGGSFHSYVRLSDGRCIGCKDG